MRPYALYGTGKIGVQYEHVLGPPEMGAPGWKLDPALSKLATGKLEMEVKRVYTPEELIREANSLKPDENVAVQFKVRLVQPAPQVAGHGPDDLGLYPCDRPDWTQKQFTAILTAGAKQQLKRLGVDDAGKHLSGKVTRVTGRISSYLPITDDPVSERQYELVIDDVSQIESVVAKADPPAHKQEQMDTAWGKEVGGLQAGLGIHPGEHRAYHHGEMVTLVVRVRNVGKEEVKFQYLKEFIDENPPAVTDADGQSVSQPSMEAGGLRHVPKEVTLAPGKVIELASKYGGASGVRYELRPAGERGKVTTGKGTPLYGTGKVGLQYERVFGDSSAGQIKLDPTLSKLATGKLELEIKPEPPPAATEKQ
jgi:hypothetical protein